MTAICVSGRLKWAQGGEGRDGRVRRRAAFRSGPCSCRGLTPPVKPFCAGRYSDPTSATRHGVGGEGRQAASWVLGGGRGGRGGEAGGGGEVSTAEAGSEGGGGEILATPAPVLPRTLRAVALSASWTRASRVGDWVASSRRDFPPYVFEDGAPWAALRGGGRIRMKRRTSQRWPTSCWSPRLRWGPAFERTSLDRQARPGRRCRVRRQQPIGETRPPESSRRLAKREAPLSATCACSRAARFSPKTASGAQRRRASARRRSP